MQNNHTHHHPIQLSQCIYYADEDDHQPNQNYNDIRDYHVDNQDNYHQDQTHEQCDNLPAHEPTDYANEQPPDQDYQYNDDYKVP